MMAQPITQSRTLAALVIAGVIAAYSVQPAAAQTAGNLQCNGCVSSKDLKNNAVTGAKVKDSSLTGSDLATQSIPSGDLSNAAGGDFAVNPLTTAQSLALTTTPVVYRTFNLTAPSAGEVVLNASGSFFATAVGPFVGICSISKDGALDVRNFNIGQVIPPQLQFMPFGITWAESVTAAGTQTWNLVCQAGTAGLFLANPALTATFVPERY